MEVGCDVRRTGVEGDVLVAGALVDGERDERGRHLVMLVSSDGCQADQIE